MKYPVIEVKNITKRFRNTIVLDNLSFKIYPGEIFGLLGPNGSGKTLLIQTLLGITEPDEGEIHILGRKLANNLSWIHQQVNFASTYSHLQEQLTIRDNLLTFAGLYGVKDCNKITNQLVKFFALDNCVRKNTKVTNLSSGENARLLICKALINNPKILFLDEPTTSLDPKMAIKVQNLISRLHQEKKLTIFIASHNLLEIKKICRRIGFLKNGRLTKITNVENIDKFFKV